jgi:hypothetical protein
MFCVLADLVTHHVAPDPDHGLMSSISAVTIRGSGVLAGNHTVRLVGWNTADVHRAQPPEPIGNAKCIIGGSVDEFCGGPPIPVSWACCVNPPQNVEPIPAPPIVAKVYPHPPSTRPQKGKASVVFFLTDDQDKLLGSVDVMNHTKSLFVDGGAVFDNFFVSAQSPRVRGFNVHEHRLLLSI